MQSRAPLARSAPRAALGARFALLAALATGCAINTDPILADGDAGAGAIDAAPPGAEDDRGAFIASVPAAYDGCDVDWRCTDGCADDLDCDDTRALDSDAGAEAGPDAGPDRDPPGPVDTITFAETGPGGAPHALAADASLWLALGAPQATEHIAATVETGALTLAVYALPGGALLARSVADPALRVFATDPPADIVLRVVAGPDGATFTLTREVVPAE